MTGPQVLISTLDTLNLSYLALCLVAEEVKRDDQLLSHNDSSNPWRTTFNLLAIDLWNRIPEGQDYHEYWYIFGQCWGVITRIDEKATLDDASPVPDHFCLALGTISHWELIAVGPSRAQRLKAMTPAEQAEIRRKETQGV